MASLQALAATTEGSSGQVVRGAVEGAMGGQAALAPALDWSSYAQAVGVLFFLLAVLWLAVWLARRFGRFSFLPRPGALPRDALVMEAQMPLGPRKGLMVVRFLNRRLLLGVTDQQITLLTEERAQDESTNADFQQIMERARRSGDG